ncbi:hypothetical protein TcBrA4_0046150 [Trypanosoma cruzi]|nr:hypothetical protein TcBrA4_0046150 [Trypanosoma cruzi]
MQHGGQPNVPDGLVQELQLQPCRTLLEDGVSVMIYARRNGFYLQLDRQQAMDDSTELAWQSGVQRSPRRAIPGPPTALWLGLSAPPAAGVRRRT